MNERTSCETCINIFHFPECCTENLTDSLIWIPRCGNYSEHKIKPLKGEEKEDMQ